MKKKEAINIIQKFEKASALKINREKSMGIDFQNENKQQANDGIRWTNKLKVLGHQIGRDTAIGNEQWKKAMENAKKLMREISNLKMGRKSRIL